MNFKEFIGYLNQIDFQMDRTSDSNDTGEFICQFLNTYYPQYANKTAEEWTFTWELIKLLHYDQLLIFEIDDLETIEDFMEIAKEAEKLSPSAIEDLIYDRDSIINVEFRNSSIYIEAMINGSLASGALRCEHGNLVARLFPLLN